MDFKYVDVPKGKLVPVYLTEDGKLVSLSFESEEHFNKVCEAVTQAVDKLFDGTIALCDEPIDLEGGYNVSNKEKTQRESN